MTSSRAAVSCMWSIRDWACRIMCHTLNREVKIDDHMKVMLCSGPPPPPHILSYCHHAMMMMKKKQGEVENSTTCEDCMAVEEEMEWQCLDYKKCGFICTDTQIWKHGITEYIFDRFWINKLLFNIPTMLGLFRP